MVYKLSSKLVVYLIFHSQSCHSRRNNVWKIWKISSLDTLYSLEWETVAAYLLADFTHCFWTKSHPPWLYHSTSLAECTWAWSEDTDASKWSIQLGFIVPYKTDNQMSLVMFTFKNFALFLKSFFLQKFSSFDHHFRRCGTAKHALVFIQHLTLVTSD